MTFDLPAAVSNFQPTQVTLQIINQLYQFQGSQLANGVVVRRARFHLSNVSSARFEFRLDGFIELSVLSFGLWLILVFSLLRSCFTCSNST